MPDTLLQMFFVEMQDIPVVSALSQSTVPHAQLAAFGDDPSVIEHSAYLRHLFWAAKQRKPVVSALTQSTVPHLQLAAFALDPSAIVQSANLRHLF
tara:strand:- start:490 stop:777 length:288 start_codon:yes stop_codon:yes gene_type:complete